MTEDKQNNNLLEESNLQDIEQFLCFGITGKVFGFELLSVHEILKPVYITRMANVQDYVLGVINLRGEIIPIVDIKRRFGLEYVKLTQASRIIVVVSEKQEKKFGVLVDEVKHVIKVEKKHISSTIDDMLSDNYSRLVTSVSRFDNNLILNLGVDDIMEFNQEET